MSGDVTFTSQDQGSFDITLDDGITFSGTVNYPFYQSEQNPPCMGYVFALPSGAGLNNVDDAVDVNYLFSAHLVFRGNQITGTVYGPYDDPPHRIGLSQLPCTLPGNISTSPETCYEPVSGTVNGFYIAPYFGPYTETVYTLSTAPKNQLFSFSRFRLGCCGGSAVILALQRSA